MARKKTEINTPENLWTKCRKCEQIIYNKELYENLKICPKCGYYFRLTAGERISLLLDPETFVEYDRNILPVDVLKFPEYTHKLDRSRKKSKLNEAVVTGEGKIGNHNAVICVLDFDYMGGSMGSVVGEKITRAIETAAEKKYPVITVASSGGARMQEGIFSLMQMAKTSAAVGRLHNAGMFYISILTDPTSGGVTASFVMLGDINIAEPKSFVGFAGPRVIEQTIRQQLPEGFQSAEFVLEHGAIDAVVERKDMKEYLIKLLNFVNKNW
jgi:acetyl-CoA carboxylase carboxyl transferase subunit beta